MFEALSKEEPFLKGYQTRRPSEEFIDMLKIEE
jgi:hypothetical protein